MKAAAKLLAELAAQNITPVSTNEKLALRGAPDRITSEIVVRVREHKADLLAHLQAEQVRVEALAVQHWSGGWQNSTRPSRSGERRLRLRQHIHTQCRAFMLLRRSSLNSTASARSQRRDAEF
jgi:TubC N-terminal docking domain